MTARRLTLHGILFVCFGVVAAPAVAAPLEFRVTYDKAAVAGPFTGRVYVLLSAKEPKELPSGPNWFKPEPFFAVDVKDWAPGEPLAVGADALACPIRLSDLPPGRYYAQAVMDLDRGARSFSAAEGNGYGRPVLVDLDPRAAGDVPLTIDQVYHAKPFPETDRVKLVDVESRLLTEFHGRPTRLRAGVVLPESFARNPDKRYPVTYEIPGFGGTHFGAVAAASRKATDVAGVEMLYVVLDPGCRLGHHVFADSANNGPCGRALVEELIPFIEKSYRGLGTPNARFVTGHSSGGWSSLWLQVAYPDSFGGVWSTSPDPVDFRDFQRVDLTRPGANLFTGDDGKPRPLARINGKPALYYKPFSDMETVMGHGGQLASFEAVFSPRGRDGRPRRLWDRATGGVDPETARAWEEYDIRLKLEREWPTLGPKLAGKLHVYTGGDDTFYLDGAVRLLQESQKRLGSDADVEIIPGRDHGTLLDKKMRERIAREMAETFRKGQAQSILAPTLCVGATTGRSASRTALRPDLELDGTRSVQDGVPPQSVGTRRNLEWGICPPRRPDLELIGGNRLTDRLVFPTRRVGLRRLPAPRAFTTFGGCPMHSTIRVRCPGCDARIKAPIQLLGQRRNCPRCKYRLVIQTKAPDDALPILSDDALPVFTHGKATSPPASSAMR